MNKLLIGALTVALAIPAVRPVSAQAAQAQAEKTPSLPSDEEIGDLLDKATEYVQTYQRAFTNAKHTLDKSPTPGFIEKATQLCSQANFTIASIKKNGPSAFALVSLIAVLDDMSLNGARASSMAMIVGMQENKANPADHAMQDFQDLAQAEKNCYDISELILHATLRYISVEESALQTLFARQKAAQPK
jgi:hypothetical protein